MLNTVSNHIFINKIITKNRIPSFRCSSGCDEFVRNTKGAENKMSCSENGDKKTKNFINNFSEKIKKLPVCFNIPFGVTFGYLKNSIDSILFSKIYLKEAPLIFQMAEYAKEKEEFNSNYNKEINLAKQIFKNCINFNNEKIDNNKLRHEIECLVEEYAQS